VLGCRSTKSERTPCRDSSSEAVSPTGPPPEIRTVVSIISCPFVALRNHVSLFEHDLSENRCTLFRIML
jgi:hypothetical protein